MRILSTSICLLTIVISMASCDGNQSIQPSNNTKKNVAAMEKACDPVNDTIYMNFHSNMKINDFTKELENNSNIENGNIILDFKDYKIPFTITPDYNGCLTAINLDAEIQFGHSKSSDNDEKIFCEYLKSELEKKYGVLKQNGDSTYIEPHTKDYVWEQSIQENIRILGFDRESLITMYKKNGQTRILKVSNWVPKYTYYGCKSYLDERGNYKSPLVFGEPIGKKETNQEDIDKEKRKPIDTIISAKYNSYTTNDKNVELIIVTTFYNHQDYFNDEKKFTQKTRVIINYYSARHWKEKEKKVKKEKEKEQQEVIKSDSVLKENQKRL